jgi:hypothetical protein
MAVKYDHRQEIRNFLQRRIELDIEKQKRLKVGTPVRILIEAHQYGVITELIDSDYAMISGMKRRHQLSCLEEVTQEEYLLRRLEQ